MYSWKTSKTINNVDWSTLPFFFLHCSPSCWTLRYDDVIRNHPINRQRVSVRRYWLDKDAKYHLYTFFWAIEHASINRVLSQAAEVRFMHLADKTTELVPKWTDLMLWLVETLSRYAHVIFIKERLANRSLFVQ